MDVQYINPFVFSICNTLETMCATKVTIGKPRVKEANTPLTDVSGVIGFSGDAAGSVVAHFTFDVASAIASKFACCEITPEHEDFSDAIGELANMIAGSAKARFEGLNISISLPNVVIGKNHNVSSAKNEKRILIPCETNLGSFLVELGMVITKTNEAKQSVVATGV